jgi:hypothetical protein
MHQMMKLFGMTQGKLEGSPSKFYLSGNGDTYQCVSATTDGFFPTRQKFA